MWIPYRLQWTSGGQYCGAAVISDLLFAHPLTSDVVSTGDRETGNTSTGDWLRDRKLDGLEVETDDRQAAGVHNL